MLLQTNSYIVPKEKRAEHARLMRRFRQALHQVGCDNFEVYEQVGANWGGTASSGRFVQIMRFRDRKHQLAVQNAERNDPAAQQLIAEFCELINYPYQQQQQQFVVGFYASALPVAPVRALTGEASAEEETGAAAADEFAQPASSAQPADSLDAGEEAQDAKLEQTFEETAAALSAEEMPVEEDASEEGAGEEIASEEESPSAQETALEEAPSEEAVTKEPAGEPLEEEDFFAEETEPAGEDEMPLAGEESGPPADEPASGAIHSEVASESPEPDPHGDDPELESDLMPTEEDDDISRLAEELAAEDEEAHNPRNGDPSLPHRGRASGNGAH